MIILKSRVDKLFLPEHGYYTAYGVDVYDKENNTLIDSIQDITFDHDKIEEFVTLCNNNDVDYIHLYDLIENFLFVEQAV